MAPEFTSFQALRRWRDEQHQTHQSPADEFDAFHERMMAAALAIALKEMNREYGPPPCRFAWFLTGSAGRRERTADSDQDHGIIYDQATDAAAAYFLAFGDKISRGLDVTGYPYCTGKVMSSNPLWCQSFEGWSLQLDNWIMEESWESIRYLLIFYDARALAGETKQILMLKQQMLGRIRQYPHLLGRLLDNTRYRKKAVGIFGQLLTETAGRHQGCVDLKTAAFFPYVNSIRLLAIKEMITCTSTLSRLKELMQRSSHQQELDHYYKNFRRLLQYRLQKGRFLCVKSLSRSEKSEIKHLLTDGKRLSLYTEKAVTRAMHP
ncbi:DUF294 nucleotidyltransferase-like domain-containing protein [Bacillus xiapuensis]|uniref:DUF294 nucleotidyltransferase-like domain-containing protein n=1 Tax=Bacillus xiapuensis TaxID=2014075 RepID=UPI000C24DD94|nr:DUF294 nucleotidyltransferase-like domain-containing protein [Bacillus xiapuensis]